MRVPTKKSYKALWTDIDLRAVAAIELASGVCFRKKATPPPGLWTQTGNLVRACRERWPEGDYTVGDMARQYLAMRTQHMEDIAHGPTDA